MHQLKQQALCLAYSYIDLQIDPSKSYPMPAMNEISQTAYLLHHNQPRLTALTASFVLSATWRCSVRENHDSLNKRTVTKKLISITRF